LSDFLPGITELLSLFVILIGGVVLNGVLKTSQHSIWIQSVASVQFLAASCLSTLAVYGAYGVAASTMDPDVEDFYVSWGYLPVGVNGVVFLVVAVSLAGLLIRRKRRRLSSQA
jgi:hypothetical protein